MPGKLGQVRRATVKASVRPTLRDLSWAAGFLEGEGCFRVASNTETVGAPQLNREPLARLQSLFGGRLKLRQKPDGRTIYEWRVSGSRARGVMMTLYVMLSAMKRSDVRGNLHRPPVRVKS
jgi:hypothetical protein